MKFAKLVDLCFDLWQSNSGQTVMLLGKPGIGKTAVGRALAQRMTEHLRNKDSGALPAKLWVKDLSSSLPEDINGLPRVNGDVMQFCPDEWLYEACQPDTNGVLVLDDLPAASGPVQVATRQLVLDRKAHEHRLAPGVFIIVTGNRREDKASASTLPSHFTNAVLSLTLDENLEDWISWRGRTQPGANNLLPSFLVWRPTHFSRVPADRDAKGSFATPRSWAMLDRLLSVAQENDELYEVASGLVGEGVAAELMGFVKVFNALVDPRKVLANPEQALPDPANGMGEDALSSRLALLGSMCAITCEKPEAIAPNSPQMQQLAKAVAWVNQGNQELTVHTLTLLRGSNEQAPHAFALTLHRMKHSNPLIGQIVQAVARALA
jgi:MoxR-like ATPase